MIIIYAFCVSASLQYDSTWMLYSNGRDDNATEAILDTASMRDCRRSRQSQGNRLCSLFRSIYSS